MGGTLLSRYLRFVFALLILSHFVEACTNVETVLKDQFKRHYMFCRRGAPGKMVTTYYKEYLHHFFNFVDEQKRTARNVRMGTICLNSTELKQFSASYDSRAVEKMIEMMHEVEKQLFYLPQSHYSDNELLPLSPTLSRAVDLIWSKSQRQLQRQASEVEIDEMKKVPGGVQFFYDPEESTVCENLEAYMAGIPTSTNALDLSFEVAAIVIRMKLLGVPDRYSLQILSHHAAFTFKTMRCTRKQMIDLKASGVFMPWYEEAFMQLTKGMNISAVPAIPTSVLKGRLPKTISALAHFRGWGNLHFLRFNEATKTVQQYHIAKRLFNPTTLMRIMSDIENSSASGGTDLDVVLDRRNGHPLSRSSKCNSGYFYHSVSCCPVICRNTHLLRTAANHLTTSSCCQSIRRGTSLYSRDFKRLSVVKLEPYGYSRSETVHVMNDIDLTDI